MRSLSARERKAVAILLLLAVLAAAQTLIVGPFLAGFAERAERRIRLTEQFQANQRLIASIPRLRRAAERQQADLHSFTLASRNEATAATMLQDRLLKAVDVVGGELRSNEEASIGNGSAGARVSAQLDLAQLSKLLAIVQDTPPYLSIDALSINADQALISRKLEPMDVALEVSIPLRPAAPR